MVTFVRSGRTWSEPINVGPSINTEDNEMFPYVHEDGTLYFASDGHAGYGKADIFKCKITNDSVYNVKHLPYPINSSGDDIHFVLHPFDESRVL